MVSRRATVTPDHANLIGAGIVRIDGHDANNPIDVSAAAPSTTGEALAPSVTTNVANTLVLRFATWDQSRTVTTAPARPDPPCSAFGLDLTQPVGTLHTRFWHGGPFTVDITSIVVL
jgi:hypothetical protein